MFDNKRLEKQLEICQTWKEKGAKGTVQAVTGFGKTNVAMLLIKEMNVRHPKRAALVVVPTIVLKEQWEEEIKKRDLFNVFVYVINTVIKKTWVVDFLILDEIHRYGALKFSEVFLRVKYKFILGLTATLKRADGNHELLQKYAPVIATIDMKQSRENGWISNYIVYNLGIPLNYSERRQYVSISNKFYRHFGFFNHDFDLTMRVLKEENLRKQIAEDTGKSEKEVRVIAINAFRAMQKRKAFINNNSKKIQYVKRITEEFPTANIIVFSETIDFAEEVADTIGDECVSYHSKLSKKQKEKALNSFKTKDSPVHILSTARALDEGFNVEGIDFAIVCSGNSTSRQAIQRMGRAIRFKEDKTAIIVNLYLIDTQEEKWLRKRMKGSEEAYWIDDLANIDYEYVKDPLDEHSDKPSFVVEFDD